MDYIEEKYASGRITGQIKIHQKEDFQGMRKVGKLAAELLFKAKKHYKQNIHLIAIPNNSYDKII